MYLERAFLTAASGENLLPDFDVPVPDKEQFDWTAQYLSRKEWPEFEVSLGGEVIFKDEVFERCHLDSEWEIDLPARLLSGSAELSIRLVSEYHEPIPYIVREVGVIEQPTGAVALIACSQVGTVQDGAYVLLRTERDNARVRFESPVLSGAPEYLFEEAGLHGVRLTADAPCLNAPFAFTCEGLTVRGEIERMVERPRDGVVHRHGRHDLRRATHGLRRGIPELVHLPRRRQPADHPAHLPLERHPPAQSRGLEAGHARAERNEHPLRAHAGRPRAARHRHQPG